MIAHERVLLTCPHCRQPFLESAKLIRVGGSAWCPACEQVFPLVESDSAIRRCLEEAKAARKRRRERLAELKLRWADPPPATLAAQRPRRLTDVLRTLDDLIERLNRENAA